MTRKDYQAIASAIWTAYEPFYKEHKSQTEFYSVIDAVATALEANPNFNRVRFVNVCTGAFKC